MGIERRAGERVRKKIHLRVDPPGHAADILDISLHGLLIESSKHYVPNAAVRLTLMLPAGMEFQCDANVVWVNPQTTTAPIYKVALQFTSLSEADLATLKKVLQNEST
ncbi:MAG: PilZ domain-containing protein [Candidatus Omnitrophica bacterium]|nr:PilZ domain-containing protein [Candidatus Omnitrophota bacterium]